MYQVCLKYSSPKAQKAPFSSGPLSSRLHLLLDHQVPASSYKQHDPASLEVFQVVVCEN
jgi:hypothetical protein